MKLAGIDIGTTSICAVVLDTESKKMVHCVTEPNRSKIPSSEPYAVLQDPNRIWSKVEELLNGILIRHQDVLGIGVSGQMHGILYVDREGNAVSPLYTWQDGRGNLTMQSGGTYATSLQQLTGHPVASGYGLVTHYYHVVNQTVPAEAVRLCTIGDFVVMKMTGCTSPLMDATNAAGIGLFQRGGFDVDALRAAELQEEMLPPIVASATRAGTCVIPGATRATRAAMTPSGIPVFTAIGDNQASFLGAVLSLRGTLLVNIGTGAQLSVWSQESWTAPGFEERPFLGNGSLHVGASLGGGKSYALLERFFRDVCRVFTDVETENLYELMEKLAQDAGETDHPLVVDPQFFGTRMDPAKRGTISNISESNFTPEGLLSAWINGMAAELWGMYRSIPSEARAGIIRFVGSGNGIQRNAALRRAIERHFGMPLTLSDYGEEAAVGAALCAGVGSQAFPDFHAAGMALRKD